MDENNIIIRITGEADLSKVEQSVRDLTNRNKELAQQLKELSAQEKQDAKTIEETVKSQERLGAKLKENAEYYKRERDYIEQQIGSNKKSIQTLQASVNQYNALSGAGVKLRQQLTALREEMVRLAESGDTTSARFIELADQAADLADTIGDAQATITLLSSDTKKLDVAMQVGGGLIGTFNAATSAMALLGGESEELQAAFLKVQAAMSVLQGVQQVMTVLDKRSAANVVLRTAAIKLLNKVHGEQAVATTAATTSTAASATASTADTAAKGAQTVATTAATVATKLFNKALLANPVMWLVAGITALIAGVSALVKHFRSAKDASDDLSSSMTKYSKVINDIEERTEFAAQMAVARGGDWWDEWSVKFKGYSEALATANANYISFVKAHGKNTETMTDQQKEQFQQILDDRAKFAAKIRELEKQQAIRSEEDRTAEKKKQEEAAKEAEERRLQEEKEAAEKRRQRMIEEWHRDNEIRIMLDNMSNTPKQKSKAEAEMELAEYRQNPLDLRELEQEEDPEVPSLSAMVENLALQKQLAGESEQEIADMKYRINAQYLEDKIALEEAHGNDTTELQNELMQLQLDNNERLRESEEQLKAAQQERLQQAIEIASQTLSTLGQMASEIFGAISDSISAQIEQLDEMYTTDAEEAKQDASKKYVSEKELEDKKAKLKLKQQRLDKANAIFQIGLNTAMAIMSIWAQVPKGDFGITAGVMTGLVAALGATQLAVAAAKPLSQYAKGRKGGEGEYALVGERGAEIMYIPNGASIIPNNKINTPASWGEYGVPTLPIPASANISQDVLNQAVTATQWQPIDYDRLGKAVANAMPKQKTVNVNVDRSGVRVSNGNDTRTYLNTKYQGTWN